MKSLLCFAALGILALVANGQAPEPKITRAMYMVTGLHCAPCVTTVEGSLKKIKGVKSIKGDFKNKSATIEFDESVISAQEVARAMSVTPHMMGKGMQYSGILLLSVPGTKDQTTGKKAEATLTKIAGVSRVTLYPQQQAVGIQFTNTGTVTTKQLIEALETAGLKGTQYGS
jgi:copper chaperone CopZ